MNHQKKTRSDTIQDKILALEMWIHRAKYLPISEEEKMRSAIRTIMKISGELWFIINTSEDKGTKLGWWE